MLRLYHLDLSFSHSFVTQHCTVSHSLTFAGNQHVPDVSNDSSFVFLHELESMQDCPEPTAFTSHQNPTALLGEERKKLSKLWNVLNSVKVRTESRAGRKDHFSSETV